MHPNFDEYALECLKRMVSEKIGYQISNRPDCLKLSEIISENGIGYISDTTIYRLFFHNGKHKPYRYTTDILSIFAGYKNSHDFLDSINATRGTLYQHGINSIGKTNKSLIFYCIQNETYKPLMDYFDSLEETPESIKESVCLNLYDSLIASNKQVPFFNEFAKNNFFREYLLEKGYDPKFRIQNHEIAYIKYIKNTDINSNFEHMQEFIFGAWRISRCSALSFSRQFPRAWRLSSNCADIFSVSGVMVSKTSASKTSRSRMRSRMCERIVNRATAKAQGRISVSGFHSAALSQSFTQVVCRASWASWRLASWA